MADLAEANQERMDAAIAKRWYADPFMASALTAMGKRS